MQLLLIVNVNTLTKVNQWDIIVKWNIGLYNSFAL